MERHNIFSIAVLASAVSGMVSPAMTIVAIFSWVWMPPFLMGSPGLVFFLSMLVTATGTLLLSGVPAALYERFVGDPGGRAALRWGPPPTLLQRAAALPLPFFAAGSRGAAALFPALLAAVTGDAHNAALLRADVALPQLRAFLADEAARPPPPPPLSRFALRARFPPEEWADAMAQLLAAEAEERPGGDDAAG